MKHGASNVAGTKYFTFCYGFNFVHSSRSLETKHANVENPLSIVNGMFAFIVKFL
jgi:hypothetical protein